MPILLETTEAPSRERGTLWVRRLAGDSVGLTLAPRDHASPSEASAHQAQGLYFQLRKVDLCPRERCCHLPLCTGTRYPLSQGALASVGQKQAPLSKYQKALRNDSIYKCPEQ